MARDKGKGRHGATCPACGQHYRVASMAAKCRRTPRCVFVNCPGSSRIDAWLRQALVIDLCTRLADSIVNETGGEERELELAHRLGKGAAQVMGTLFEAYLITEDVARRHRFDNIQTARALYDDEGTAAIGPFLEALLLLVEDMQEEYAGSWADVPGLAEMPRLVSVVEDVLREMFEYFCSDPSDKPREGQPEMLDVYDTFHDAIFGKAPERKAPSVYLVNGRLWCVSYGRPQLRHFLLTRYGISRPSIEGIAPGEVLEDGHRAEWLASLAREVPSMVGRVEQ